MILFFFIFAPFIAFAININDMYVEVSVDPVFLGSSSQIEIKVNQNPPTATHWDISVDFGDGQPAHSGACIVDWNLLHCSVSFSHQYGSPGSYTVVATVCDGSDATQCKTGSKNAVVNSPPVCGNGTLEPPNEQCDDGNTVSGDGCSGNCRIEGPPQPPTTNNDLNPLNAATFGELFRDIANMIFWVAIVLGPLLIIVGGFMIIFAGLETGKIILGKKIILYTAVILGIILIIKAMTSFFAPDITFQ